MKTNRKYAVVGVGIFFTIILASCLKSKEDATSPGPTNPGQQEYVYKWTEIADSAQTSLNYFWSPADKSFTATNSGTAWGNYWPTAHALDVLVDLYERKPNAATKARMDEVVTGVKAKNG